MNFHLVMITANGQNFTPLNIMSNLGEGIQFAGSLFDFFF